MSFRINTNVSAMNALRNLNQTGVSFGSSINKLSTGFRINTAADDPAGLIASENFRAQISGVTQAIKNSQDALSYAKTAEGALDEISRLMRESRSLAVSSANTGTLSNFQLQSNQTQMDLITRSIDRIAQETQFGRKKMLDGTAGVNSVVVNAVAFKSMTFGGEIGTQTLSTGGAVNVNVTTAATKATITGTRMTATPDLATFQATALGAAGSFSVNGTTFQMAATDTFGDVVKRVNDLAGHTGVVAEAIHDGANGQIELRQTTYGSNFKISLVDATGVILAASGTATAAGVDAVADITVGTLTPVTFTAGATGDDGLTLTDSQNNRIVLTEGGNAVAALANVAEVTVGTAQFQTGGNANQVAFLSIPDFSATALGFAGLDVTTATGANTAIQAIDAAIDQLNLKRGEIGSFMSYTLESNIRSLGVARENLTATESHIRDTDMADEMTTFTKLQILQQSGIAVLAQANSAPQAILAMLRG